MPSTSNDTALAAMTQLRASRSVICIHDLSTGRDVIDRETKVTPALTAQYVATVAMTTQACHTHSNVLGTALSHSNSRPDASAPAAALPV